MPELKLEDTICAIATASGEAALSIVRLSGPQAISIADNIFRAKSGRSLKEARAFTVHYGDIFDAETAVDECLVTIFRKPRSFTAEDMVEFSTHGGTHAARKLVDLCCCAGARVAEPGEFTKWAFINGRIDLTQAEAVIDIIRSTNDRSLRQAVRQLQGQLSTQLKELKQRLLLVLAHIEAYVDFPEEDQEVFTNEKFKSEIEGIKKDLQLLLETYKSGLVIRNGILCVIVGKPNVGKSSLLNALLGQDRAIVTDIPGTTRDSLEEGVVWEGVSVRLVDTAGLGEPKDTIDFLGMERTRKYLEQADFYLWVVDGSEPITQEDLSIGHSIGEKPSILLINKTDLEKKCDERIITQEFNGIPRINCSALRSIGLEEIKKSVVQSILKSECQLENAHLTRERHRTSVAEAIDHLSRAEKSFSEKMSLEFLAADLRGALRSLSELIGEVYTDDLLDVIFREFCVGK